MTITEITGADIDAAHAALLDLYASCYLAPPWNETEEDVARYASRIREWAALDSFTGLVAHDPDGALVGTAYGWVGPAESHGVRLPGAPGVEPFHVADLMVHPTARRRGLGRTLLDRLVADRTPAMLLTHPDSPSRRLYEAAGWRATGTIDLPDATRWTVYVLD